MWRFLTELEKLLGEPAKMRLAAELLTAEVRIHQGKHDPVHATQCAKRAFELYLEATRSPELAAEAKASFAAYEEIAIAALRSAGAKEPERLAPLFIGLV